MPLEFLQDSESVQFAFTKARARNSGLAALPVYGNPSKDSPTYPNGASDERGTDATAIPCRIVRLHAPIETMVISWTATKRGAAPIVPNPYLFDKNSVFSHGSVGAAVPVDDLQHEGHIWAMAGEYHYFVVKPRDLNSSVTAGVTPWETQVDQNASIIPNMAYVSHLLEDVDNPTREYVPPEVD